MDVPTLLGLSLKMYLRFRTAFFSLQYSLEGFGEDLLVPEHLETSKTSRVDENSYVYSQLDFSCMSRCKTERIRVRVRILYMSNITLCNSFVINQIDFVNDFYDFYK